MAGASAPKTAINAAAPTAAESGREPSFPTFRHRDDPEGPTVGGFVRGVMWRIVLKLTRPMLVVASL
jgi:hypothetical protein